MRRTVALLTALAIAAPRLGAQSPTTARLDSIVREAMAAERLVGLSVAVVKGRDTLLNRGYGFADLSQQVPASASTTYRFTGISLTPAVMREVEQGRIALDDDVTRILPDFPWQGRTVTLRQLMDATSGLVDFHYTGDAHQAHIAVPKSPDEVSAIFAGRPFVHEPGAAWQWTASGFHLAGLVVERTSGMPFGEYVRRHVFEAAGLARTFYCDDRSITPGLARSYVYAWGQHYNARMESASMFPYLSTTCTTAADAVSLARALRDGRLLKPATWRVMTTAVGPAAALDEPRGVGIRMPSEQGHKWYGITGNLMSFGFAVADFVDDSLTIAVLTNTSSQAPNRLARNLARAVFGLPQLPPPEARARPPELVERTPLAEADHARYVGTYPMKWIGAPPTYASFVRTARVFSFSGQLWIQLLGEEAYPLLHQGQHVFVSRVGRATFTVAERRATSIDIQSAGQLLRGPRTQ